MPIYLESEILEYRGLDREEVQLLLEAKSIFNGIIVEAPERDSFVLDAPGNLLVSLEHS